jgi:biopolymer transport protein ExbD
MPIVAPGKRPAKRFEHSKILGGKMGHGRKSNNVELNVIPMVDIMTMLTMFLLMQFSATGEVLMMQKDLKLPEANHGQLIERAPVIAVTKEQVVVEGQKVADIMDIDKDDFWNIPALEERLRDEKKRWDYIHQNDPDREKNWKGDINIQADVKVPFKYIKRVMFSCNQAGYYNINFATLAGPGATGEGGAPATPVTN